MSAVTYSLQDGIATIVWNDPNRPMNVMSMDALLEFEAVIDVLITDSACTGVVIASGRKEFIVGADISLLVQLRQQSAEEVYAQIRRLSLAFRRIETSGKPFVAAIGGDALGGGFELALACHYRVVADINLKLGLPEVQLGILPGAGGTQRLPRLLGAQEALKLLTTGKNLRPAEALRLGAIHEVCPPEALLERAKAALLEKRVKTKQPWDENGFVLPKTTYLDDTWLQTFGAGNAMLRGQTFDNYPAPRAIMACVYQGLQLSMDSALKYEARQFVTLFLGKVSTAMTRTLWFGRNRANKLEKRPVGIEKTQFSKVGVLGAGVMGAGIAIVTVEAGIPCVLLDVTQEAAERGKQYAAEYWARQVEKKRLSSQQAQALLERLTASTDYGLLAGAELVIEAVFENREVKAKVTQQAEAVLLENAVFGSNTSTLPISGLAQASSRAGQFIGIHFFSPVEKMPLVEIIRGSQTSDHATAVAMDYVAAIKKTPIVVNDSRGFYTSRVFGTYGREAFTMLREGIVPTVIENVGKASGMPMGPFELMDMIGVDTAHKIGHATLNEVGREKLLAQGEQLENLELLDWMVETNGRTGQKVGKGFWDYAGRKPSQLWAELYSKYPPQTSAPDVEEMKRRFLHIQALETIRCLEEKVVTAADDADVGSILGWGFAPWTGGVLSYVDGIGMAQFCQECEDLATKYGKRFEPPALLKQMAQSGQKFYPTEPS
jgi:3-hydroxyacyl-CoA dehydrogenase / enoyl-CoA hydratase / 3-hydroxybutyryl-CoA epimerase